MIDIASLRAMAAAGATVEVILAAIEAAQGPEQKRVSERRAKDAKRQKRYRESRGVTRTNAESRPVTRNPCDNADGNITPSKHSINSERASEIAPIEHIDNTLTKDSIKKVSKKVYLCADIPELPPEAAITFAKAEGGWLLERTLREWQRFRDYQISKNKKHNSLVALLASWRNWVRSPFQATGKSDDRSVLKAADRQMDRFGGREAAANYVPGSSGPRPLGLDHGHEPPSPKLISSR